MSGKIYVGDVGTAILADCGVAVTGAEDIIFEVTKPDGAAAEWAAEVTSVTGVPNFLVHYTVAGDLDQPGTYRVQPHFRVGSWTGKGETAKLKVYDGFK